MLPSARPRIVIVDSRGIGWVIVVGGIVAIVIGLLVASGALSWFGRLPGDIRIEWENSRIYVPITSMILVSVVLSVLLGVLRRFFG